MAVKLQPLNILSNSELQAIERLLDIYVPEENLRATLQGIKVKLQNSEHGANLQETLTRSVLQTRVNGTEVMALDRKDSPMLRFVECPTSLDVSTLCAGYSSGRTTFRTFSDGEVRVERVERNYRGEDQQVVFRLNVVEAEVLAAFMQFHMNRRRGDYTEYVTVSDAAGPQEKV